jgi:isoleucyl-tRNA synthetase
MTSDLSAFYFDIRKDALYCDPYSSVKRKACLTVLDQLFRCTVTWLAPMLCFTAEEAWLSRYGDAAKYVHLEMFPEVPALWQHDKLADKWRKIWAVRRVVIGCIGNRAAHKKQIGRHLAHPIVHVSNEELFEAVVDCDLAEACITSAAIVRTKAPVAPFICRRSGVAVVPNLAEKKMRALVENPHHDRRRS